MLNNDKNFFNILMVKEKDDFKRNSKTKKLHFTSWPLLDKTPL